MALLAYRRVWRSLPLFFAYLVFGVASDSIMLYLYYRHPTHYFNFFIWEMSLDSALQYAVLVDVARSVLRPFRAALPAGTMLGISLLLIALGAAAWPIANLPGFAHFRPPWQLLAHAQASIATLRILFFLVMAAGSHLLSIGWRDRELQVATGLGAYSLVSMAGSILHSYQSLGAAYHMVDFIIAASYFLSMLYWIVSFAQKEAARREVTPQMQSVLTALAGTARAQRALLANSVNADTHR